MSEVRRDSWDVYFMKIAEQVATRATCDRKHVAGQVVGQALEPLAGLDIGSQQIEEGRYGGVLMPFFGAADNDQAILAQSECNLAARIDAQGLAYGLGQRDLALGGEGGQFMDVGHGAILHK